MNKYNIGDKVYYSYWGADSVNSGIIERIHKDYKGRIIYGLEGSRNRFREEVLFPTKEAIIQHFGKTFKCCRCCLN